MEKKPNVIQGKIIEIIYDGSDASTGRMNFRTAFKDCCDVCDQDLPDGTHNFCPNCGIRLVYPENRPWNIAPPPTEFPPTIVDPTKCPNCKDDDNTTTEYTDHVRDTHHCYECGVDYEVHYQNLAIESVVVKTGGAIIR